MASKDFDVDELAAYLHLTPPQIEKLATRGKLPGRRVAGKWKFAEPEIHHWLEERIGLSDEAELGSYERMLRRTATGEESEIHTDDLFFPEAIEVPLHARTRNSVIRRMCELAGETGLLWDINQMADAVAAREELHPTALENGVAMLHPRRPQSSILAQSLVAFGRTFQPLPFGNRAGHLTDVFFLICSYDDREHLRILARLSRMLTDNEWLTKLREAATAAEARQILADNPIEIDS